jgi:hypothetical protein
MSKQPGAFRKSIANPGDWGMTSGALSLSLSFGFGGGRAGGAAGCFPWSGCGACDLRDFFSDGFAGIAFTRSNEAGAGGGAGGVGAAGSCAEGPFAGASVRAL